MENILNVAGITAILVFIVTLLFQYFPGLRVKWAGVKSEVKSLVVLGIYIVVGAVVGFGGCVDVIAQIIPQLMCANAPTFIQYVFAVFVAVGAGQGIFELLPELKDVQAARSERPY
jgi:hypothetical protein